MQSSKKFLNLNFAKKDYQDIIKFLSGKINKQITGYSVYRMLDEDDNLSEDEWEDVVDDEGVPAKKEIPYNHAIDRGFGCTVFGTKGVLRNHKLKINWCVDDKCYNIIDKNTDLESSDAGFSNILCKAISSRKYKDQKKTTKVNMLETLKGVIQEYESNKINLIPVQSLRSILGMA